MKKLILLLFFPLFINGQGMYSEFNFGAALVADNIPLPGFSFLFGKRFEKSESNFILDMEVGLALPSIVTAKIGGGFFLNKEKKSAVTVGIRPWPLHLYGQVNFNERPRGQWIVSLELGSAIISRYTSSQRIEWDALSFWSRGIINFGYRWNIKKKQDI